MHIPDVKRKNGPGRRAAGSALTGKPGKEETKLGRESEWARGILVGKGRSDTNCRAGRGEGDHRSRRISPVSLSTIQEIREAHQAAKKRDQEGRTILEGRDRYSTEEHRGGSQ